MNKSSSNLRGSFKTNSNSYLNNDEKLSSRVHKTLLNEVSNEKRSSSRNTVLKFHYTKISFSPE